VRMLYTDVKGWGRPCLSFIIVSHITRCVRSRPVAVLLIDAVLLKLGTALFLAPVIGCEGMPRAPTVVRPLQYYSLEKSRRMATNDVFDGMMRAKKKQDGVLRMRNSRTSSSDTGGSAAPAAAAVEAPCEEDVAAIKPQGANPLMAGVITEAATFGVTAFVVHQMLYNATFNEAAPFSESSLRLGGWHFFLLAVLGLAPLYLVLANRDHPAALSTLVVFATMLYCGGEGCMFGLVALAASLVGLGRVITALRGSLPAVSPSPEAYALVTGASSGIGRAIAKDIASRGYNTILVARSAAELESLAHEIRSLPTAPQSVVVVQDLAMAGAAAAVHAVTTRHQLRVEILVNCAGLAKVKPLHEVEASEVRPPPPPPEPAGPSLLAPIPLPNT
jgi:hypothetical protein